MAKSNPIWQFFEKVGDSKAKYNDCNSLGSDQPRFQTVTGLKSHMAKCHKNIRDVYLERTAKMTKMNANVKAMRRNYCFYLTTFGCNLLTLFDSELR